MTGGNRPVPEFSRPIALPRLGRDGLFPIHAEAEECQALARRFGLVTLNRLEAEVRLTRRDGGRIELAAELAADIVQSCVVSLAPVAAVINDRFSLLYAPAPPEGAETINLDDEIIEVFEGDIIDIGEAVAQQLGLALDPYPRAPGLLE